MAAWLRIDFVEDIFKEHEGKDLLNFVVYDIEDRMQLQMPSRGSKVKISQQLLNTLDMQELKYKLN